VAQSQLEQPVRQFAALLAAWRTRRGLSQKELARQMGFDPSYISHVESGRYRPTQDFARRAEAVLDAGQDIWRGYVACCESRRAQPSARVAPAAGPGRAGPLPVTGLIVERETATLSYLDGVYHCSVRRRLYNAGPEPVIRYPVRVSVDRFPGDPGRSACHHAEHPLTVDELGFSAVTDQAPDEEMLWRVTRDYNCYKRIVLLFASARARFPLYPGHRADVTYSYRVSEEKWGPWFEREIRLPTAQLSVRLRFPRSVRPVVWGERHSLTGDEPLNTPVAEAVEGDVTTFEWLSENPLIPTRYRFQWRFRPG